MPRYLVERTFPEGSALPAPNQDSHALSAVIDANILANVIWVHSYVTADRHKSFCICVAPTPEAVRHAAQCNGWPIDRITEVQVLDPYSYA